MIIKFETGNSKNYKIKVMKYSIIYAKEVKNYLLEFYYLDFWKIYLEKAYT